jgi:hypothetical protein
VEQPATEAWICPEWDSDGSPPYSIMHRSPPSLSQFREKIPMAHATGNLPIGGRSKGRAGQGSRLIPNPTDASLEASNRELDSPG